jgi:hypothetical protein
MSPLRVITSFYINQKEVILSFCENKDKPKLNCEGKCHLKKILIEKHPPESENSFCSENINYPIGLVRGFYLKLLSFEFVSIKFSKFSGVISSPFLNQKSPPPRV